MEENFNDKSEEVKMKKVICALLVSLAVLYGQISNGEFEIPIPGWEAEGPHGGGLDNWNPMGKYSGGIFIGGGWPSNSSTPNEMWEKIYQVVELPADVESLVFWMELSPGTSWHDGGYCWLEDTLGNFLEILYHTGGGGGGGNTYPWHRVAVDISAYAGQKLRICFGGHNFNGFLDHVCMIRVDSVYLQPGQQMLVNGDFEQGIESWEAEGPDVVGLAGDTPDLSEYSATIYISYFASNSSTPNEWWTRICQDVQLPDEAESLVFWMEVEPPYFASWHDGGYCWLEDTLGNFLEMLYHTGGGGGQATPYPWHRVAVDISAYAGQKLRICFGGHNSNGYGDHQNIIRVDSVYIKTSQNVEEKLQAFKKNLSPIAQSREEVLIFDKTGRRAKLPYSYLKPGIYFYNFKSKEGIRKGKIFIIKR